MVRALCRPVLPYQTHPSISLWTLVCTPSPNCSYKVGGIEFTKLSWQTEALSIPGQHQKNRPIALSLLQQHSWHNVVRQATFSWHLPNPGSLIKIPETQVWFITPQNTFSLLQSRVAVCFRPLHPAPGIVLGDVRLHTVAWPWKPMPNMPECIDINARKDLYRCSYWISIELANFKHYAAQPSATLHCNFMRLPLYGWVAVVAKWLHFSLIPLTVNSEMIRREDISKTGMLQQWHPHTLKFNEFFRTNLFSHMFVKA